jgi:hypothetical protein
VQMTFIPAGRLTPAASVDVAVKIFMMPFRNAFSTVPRSEDDNPYTYTCITKSTLVDETFQFIQ